MKNSKIAWTNKSQTHTKCTRVLWKRFIFKKKIVKFTLNCWASSHSNELKRANLYFWKLFIYWSGWSIGRQNWHNIGRWWVWDPHILNNRLHSWCEKNVVILSLDFYFIAWNSACALVFCFICFSNRIDECQLASRVCSIFVRQQSKLIKFQPNEM